MNKFKIIAGVAKFGVEKTAKKLGWHPGEVRKALKDLGLSRGSSWETTCFKYIIKDVTLEEINLTKWVDRKFNPIEEEIEI
jgi:hypothetical protein